MLRIQREEGQYAQHMQTRTANLGAYQTEKQAEVGVAGADALGKMGVSGAGNVDLGGNGGGFNPASIMTSIALGNVVGQNVAGTMGNAMSGMNQHVQTGMMPPPVPTVVYYVAVSGQATGPYDLSTLTQMAIAGAFTKQSLVWKQGMAAWVAAETVQELLSVFAAVPPAPPVV